MVIDLVRKHLISNVCRAPEDEGGAAPVAEAAPDAAPSEAAPEVVADAAPVESSETVEAAPVDGPEADQSAVELEPAAEAEPEKKSDGPEPSLLEEAGTKDEPEEGKKEDSPSTEPDKPDAEKQEGEGDKTEAEKKAEGAPDKPQPRTYEAFKVPDGISLDNERVTEFTGVLEDGELSHQDRAQKLVDMHVAEMERVSQDMLKHQQKTWKDYQDRLKDDFRKDPELGGNRAETTLGLAKSVIEQYGGSDEQISETLKMLSYTGAGNHAGLIRVLNNVALLLQEGEPVSGNPPNPSTGSSRKQRWYGNNGNAS